MCTRRFVYGNIIAYKLAPVESKNLRTRAILNMSGKYILETIIIFRKQIYFYATQHIIHASRTCLKMNPPRVAFRCYNSRFRIMRFVWTPRSERYLSLADF